MLTVSIGLGVVSKAGYLRENPKTEALLLKEGTYLLKEDKFPQVADLGFSNADGDAGTIMEITEHLFTGIGAFGICKPLDLGFEVTHAMMDN